MQDIKANHQESINIAVTPLKGLLISAGSILAVIAAVAIPFLGESLFAVVFYNKSLKKAFK